MRIGELAARTGTTTRALRYYEQQQLLDPTRCGNNYRDYDEAAVLRVRRIRVLLEAGFTSATVAVLLPCTSSASTELVLCPEIVAEMRRTLRGIECDLDELTRQRSAVAGLLDTGLLDTGLLDTGPADGGTVGAGTVAQA